MKRNGRLEVIASLRSLAPLDRCFPWPGHVDRYGYGKAGKGKAHRWVYEQMVGPIPTGLEIDHLCRNRACVNPDHLEPVTHQENGLRGVGVGAVNAAKTHCYRGHPFDDENTNRNLGRRACRKCACIRSAEYKLRRAGQPAIGGAS